MTAQLKVVKKSHSCYTNSDTSVCLILEVWCVTIAQEQV